MTISTIRVLPALAATALAAAACSNGEAAERWSVSNSQIGPVTARTAFDRDTLAGLLPGFDVVEAEAWSEGMAYPVIEARRTADGEAEIVFDGEGERLLAVRVRTAGLVEASADIGDAAGEAGLVGPLCVAGMEERSGDVHCDDPELAGLSYWMSIDYAGPDGVLPPADIMAAGTVYEIVWRTVGR
ncbi:DUF1131 family protein [Maricaulis sp.]|uniref:DUF1131 family protein n=1 Tax=Maricaulis sp. TaxID=1486257 RepID=UPI003299115B